LGTGAKYVVVSTPNDLVLAEGGAVPLKPGPNPKPGHDGIDQPGESIDGQAHLPGDGAGIVLCDEAQAVGSCIAIQFRAAVNELLDIRQNLRRITVTKARHLRITEQNVREQGKRNAATEPLGQAHAPPHRVLNESAGEDHRLDL
jgi:hypothetical protein